MNQERDEINHGLGELRAITYEYVGAFDLLSTEELNWKPDLDSWSIGQVIDHIITLNETYYSKFTQIKAGQMKLPFHANVGFVPRKLGQLLLSSLSKDRKKKFKTVAPFHPSSSDISGDILERYKGHKKELLNFLEEHRAFISSKIIMTSPASNTLVYSTLTAVQGMAMHEIRHFEQAKEVLEHMRVAQSHHPSR